MNMPIYRAKKFDSDEYVTGHYVKVAQFNTIIPYDEDMISIGSDLEFSAMDLGEEVIQIDIKTLAIHFPDMLDSEGNKIFASLSKDGKGGDMLESNFYKENEDLNGTAKYHKGRISISLDGFMPKFSRLKVIGIKTQEKEEG